MCSYQLNSNNNNAIYFQLADITDMEVDAIINFVNPKLSNQDALNLAILRKGGTSVKMQLNQKWSQQSSHDFNTLVITDGGNLYCENVMHTTSFVYKPNNVGYSDGIIQKIFLCLRRAEMENFRSVAFPVIQSEHIQEIILKSYHRALLSYKNSGPKEIYCVCGDKDLFEGIKTEFRTELTACKSPVVLHNNQLVGDRREERTRTEIGGIVKTPTTNASGGSFLQDKPAAKSGLQTNHSAMAIASGTMASEVTPMASATPGPTGSNDSCPICLCDFTDQKTLDKCGHSFCSACIDHSFSAVGPYCPICQIVYGKVIGLQPPGTMTVQKDTRSLPGFPGCGMYVVQYEIPSGIQQKDHPNPGKRFYGTSRVAFLPGHKKGEIVLKMLQKAFLQKLIFTVGVSRTTNMKDTVTWNDIHHKTSIDGGPFEFGYPDPDYLKRVTLELEAKGVDAQSVAHEQIKNYLSV